MEKLWLSQYKSSIANVCSINLKISLAVKGNWHTESYFREEWELNQLQFKSFKKNSAFNFFYSYMMAIIINLVFLEQ